MAWGADKKRIGWTDPVWMLRIPGTMTVVMVSHDGHSGPAVFMTRDEAVKFQAQYPELCPPEFQPILSNGRGDVLG